MSTLWTHIRVQRLRTGRESPAPQKPSHSTAASWVLSGEMTCLLAEDIYEVEQNEETEQTSRAGDCMTGAEKIVTAGGGTLEDTQWS
ncbi:hypothetical protein HYFRA_00011719 [Hymenoscyphus fraxineus]|uniref:Uncharacterized protein n=1 Tax=Hymenoscyphus fraxineus TaxID=746836 RepID=A0A9N9PJI0_9HELO|nr:hypothetical protein HYFRA_00011719 [Hymenoscyphus fraxineus]